MASKPDYYLTLGVSPTASKKDIKAAYRQLAKALHPDRNPGDKGAEQRFQFVNEAYETLKDDRKRAKFDALHGIVKPAADAAVHPKSQTVWPDMQQAQSGAQPINTEFSLFADPEAARFLLAIALGLCALIFIGHTAFLNPGFLFGVAVTAVALFFFRDDVAYFISIAAPRHLVYSWAFVLLIVFTMAYGDSYELLANKAPAQYGKASVIVAPFRLLFFLYFLIANTGWQWVMTMGVSAWFIMLFITSVRLAGFILFGLLFLATILARYDTSLMADFVLYYDQLFSIEKPRSL
jgi:hypothetical protein